MCGIGHNTWLLDQSELPSFRHVVPAWTKLGAVPSQNTTFSPVALQEEWGRLVQPVRRAVPQLIPEGLGTRFHLAVARDVEHPFLRPPTTYNPVVYATKYALQSERDYIAQRLEVTETLQVLADAVYSEILHALRLVEPFLLPVVARRNFLVMRKVSVVISWKAPKLIVDLFFGLPQLGWAMPAPTMQLREAPPEYPSQSLKAHCGDHNSKLIFSESPFWR